MNKYAEKRLILADDDVSSPFEQEKSYRLPYCKRCLSLALRPLELSKKTEFFSKLSKMYGRISDNITHASEAPNKRKENK